MTVFSTHPVQNRFWTSKTQPCWLECHLVKLYQRYQVLLFCYFLSTMKCNHVWFEETFSLFVWLLQLWRRDPKEERRSWTRWSMRWASLLITLPWHSRKMSTKTTHSSLKQQRKYPVSQRSLPEVMANISCIGLVNFCHISKKTREEPKKDFLPDVKAAKRIILPWG